MPESAVALPAPGGASSLAALEDRWAHLPGPRVRLARPRRLPLRELSRYASQRAVYTSRRWLMKIEPGPRPRKSAGLVGYPCEKCGEEILADGNDWNGTVLCSACVSDAAGKRTVHGRLQEKKEDAGPTERRRLAWRYGAIALLVFLGTLTVAASLGSLGALVPAVSLLGAHLTAATGLAHLAWALLFLAKLGPLLVFGQVWANFESATSRLSSFPVAGATEIVSMSGSDIVLFDALTQTTTLQASADTAMANAITKIGSTPGVILWRAGAYTFTTTTAPYALPANVSIVAEQGATFATGTGFTGTVQAQYTAVPLILLGAGGSAIGLTEATGAVSAALLCTSATTTQTTVVRCKLVSQLQVPQGATLGAPNVLVQGCTFEGATFAISSSSTTSQNQNPCSIFLDRNQFLTVPLSVSTITTLGSNIASQGLGIFQVTGNVLTTNTLSRQLAANTSLIGVRTSSAFRSNFSGNWIFTPTLSGCTLISITGGANPGNFPTWEVVDNTIWANGYTGSAFSPADNPDVLKIVSTGNLQKLTFSRNQVGMANGTRGTASAAHIFSVSNQTASTNNEIFCQDNVLVGNVTNHFLCTGISGQTATQGHTLLFTGNYGNRCGQDNLRIEPNAGVYTDITITSNHFTDYNWVNSTSPVYSGIALNRSASGTIVGPIRIDNNSMLGSDSNSTTANLTGLFVGGTYSQLTIGQNTYYLNTQAGTTTPGLMNNTVGGLTFTIPGSVAGTPATSAVAQVNQVSMPAGLLISGGTVTAIAINGVTIPGVTSGLFGLGPLDTVTVTYSVTPTTYTWIVHG